MGNNRHNEDSVNDFRKTLADLIRQNDQRTSQRPDVNPASKPRHPHHPHHQPAYTRHAGNTRPPAPGHVAGLPHPAPPPSQHHRAASRAPAPTAPRASREEMFESQMSSVMAKHGRHRSADSGMKVQAGLFAVGLIAACTATFGLVYYLVADDRVTQGSSHFQAQTAQAISGTVNPDASGNTTVGTQVAASPSQPQAGPEPVASAAASAQPEVRTNAVAENAKALSDIANGNWLVLPSDVQKQVQSEGAASVGQKAVNSAPAVSTVRTRQELFESFQIYLEKTGLAPATDNPHQEALFNSFVRWNIEVAKAN